MSHASVDVRRRAPAGNPFADLLDQRVSEAADKPFVQTVDGRERSFAQLRAGAHAWATRLLELGVTHGSRVALLVDSRPEFIEIWFGCQLLGATVAPFNPHLPEDTHRYLLRLIEPRLCVIGTAVPAPAFEAAVAAEGLATLRLDDAPAPEPAGDVSPAAIGTTHASQIIFTSGTTGRPKAAIQNVSLIHGLMDTARRIGLVPEDRLYTTSPLFHGLGQAWFQYAAGMGATVVLGPRFSASGFWDHCRATDATAVQHVGAILSFLLRQPPSERDRDHRVRLTFGVGAPTPVWTAFEARFGVEVVEYYGMTEIGLVAFNTKPAKVGSVGRPTGLLDLRLAGDDGEPVPQGEPGEAWTRPLAPGGSAAEYFGDPVATAAAQRDGWFMTGDLLREDDDGYLFFLGRKKESLRRRGENIVPEDVERSVLTVPGVSDVAAVGVPSPHGDEDIKLCLVLSEPAPEDLGPLSDQIRAALPATMQPGFLALYDALPYTPTQKLQRVQLRGHDRPLWDVETGAWQREEPSA